MPKTKPKTLTEAAVQRLKPHPTKRRVVRDPQSQSLFLMIQPSGHKSWIMRFRRGDGAAKMFLGPLDASGRPHTGEPEVGQPLSLVAARRLASRINSDRAVGVDVVGAHRAKKHHQKVAAVEAATNSFAAAAKDFITQHAQPNTRGARETAANLGFDAELGAKPNGLAARWGDRSIKSIDANDLHAAVEEARKFSIPGVAPKRDEVSENRARKLHASLSQMFGWLKRSRRVDVNPMIGLHPPAVPAARDRVLTDAEIAQVWVAFTAAKEPFTSVLRLLLLTGCRRDEISKLEWTEVSDDCSVITLPGTKTKNRFPFLVPLPSQARDLIAARQREGKYVFSTTGGIAPISGWSKVKARVDAAAENIAPWRVHDLRRTCATGMASIGVPPHTIEACLNHVSGFKNSVAGTYNRYAYLDEKRDALAKWADHVRSIVGGKRGSRS
jgi:integrase